MLLYGLGLGLLLRYHHLVGAALSRPLHVFHVEAHLGGRTAILLYLHVDGVHALLQASDLPFIARLGDLLHQLEVQVGVQRDGVGVDGLAGQALRVDVGGEGEGAVGDGGLLLVDFHVVVLAVPGVGGERRGHGAQPVVVDVGGEADG